MTNKKTYFKNVGKTLIILFCIIILGFILTRSDLRIMNFFETFLYVCGIFITTGIIHGILFSYFREKYEEEKLFSINKDEIDEEDFK